MSRDTNSKRMWYKLLSVMQTQPRTRSGRTAGLFREMLLRFRHRRRAGRTALKERRSQWNDSSTTGSPTATTARRCGRSLRRQSPTSPRPTPRKRVRLCDLRQHHCDLRVRHARIMAFLSGLKPPRYSSAHPAFANNRNRQHKESPTPESTHAVLPDSPRPKCAANRRFGAGSGS